MLGARLGDRRGSGALVLGLPRGGVIVAAEVAAALEAPLDVLVVRKIGLPERPELAMGAVAGLGEALTTVQVEQVLARWPVPDGVFEEVRRAEVAELRRRERAYRAGRPPLDVAGRDVVLVDDGLATGATMRAAMAAVCSHGAARVTVAVPVGSPPTCGALQAPTERMRADEVVCLWMPSSFRAVGEAYRRFPPTGDDEVRAALAGS